MTKNEIRMTFVGQIGNGSGQGLLQHSSLAVLPGVQSADSPAIYLLEEKPPRGHKPVEWMLLCSLPVATLNQALRLISVLA